MTTMPTSSSSTTMPTTIVSPGLETSTLLSSIYNLSSIDEDVGSAKFMVAYCINLERLCIQAHLTAGYIGREKSTSVNINGVSNGSGGYNGNSNSRTFAATPGLDDVLSSLMTTGSGVNNHEGEEYIVQAFLDNSDKIECLVKTLLMLELWRENVLFHNKKQQCSSAGDENDNNAQGVAVAISEEEEEEEVEFEIEGGERDEDEYYNELNDVDGGDDNNNNNNNSDTNNVVAISNTTTADNNGRREGEEVGFLANRLANNGNALRTAFILHAETTIVSLLSLIFFKGVPPELLEGSSSGGGEDALLSLVDYCARQLIFLGSPEQTNPALSRQKNPLPASQLSTYLQSRSRMDEIQDSMYDATYQTAIASVALSRYLCENVNDLGPSLLSRMLEVHDFPLLLIPLVEEPPWTRRRTVEKRGTTTTMNKEMMIWEKLDERNEWKEVPTTELLCVTQLEGQPWLALFHLTTSKAFRESYGLDEYRKSQLMRLRKYIHESLTDQLPVLGEVARYLDELSILGVPPAGQGVHRPSSNASSSGLLLQRVDTLRESIVGGKRNMLNDEYWKGVAQTQWDEIFSHVTDATDQELRRIASEVYGGDSGVEDGLEMLGNDGWTGVHTKEEDWKVKMSKPIEKIVLHMKDDANGSNLASFELVPVQKNRLTITDTPLGQFTRMKLSITQTDGEGEAIDPRAKVVARVSFQNEDPSSSMGEEEVKDVMISIDSLELPTVDHGTSQSSLYEEVGIELPLNTFPSKEWRQLGDLEGNNIILQLGFKRLSRGVVPAGSSLLRGYSLSRAFVSQPLVR